MDQSRKLIRLALFGTPIKASLSPRIQRLFAQQFDLECEFQCIETDLDGFPESLKMFRLGGGTGCNITLPLKQAAWQLATGATAEVKLAHSANTLVYQHSNGWFAHTTDGAGLVQDLVVNHGYQLAGQRVLVMGAGGASAGILASLQAGGPQEIVLVNRNQERANALAQRFAPGGKITASSWVDLPAKGRFDLVINATSMGHCGQAPALEASLFAPGAVCYDLNYHRASQPLQALCKQMGQPYIDGLGMLVEQAAKSFYIWTGKRPDSAGVIKSCAAGT